MVEDFESKVKDIKQIAQLLRGILTARGVNPNFPREDEEVYTSLGMSHTVAIGVSHDGMGGFLAEELYGFPQEFSELMDWRYTRHIVFLAERATPEQIKSFIEDVQMILELRLLEDVQYTAWQKPEDVRQILHQAMQSAQKS